MPRNVQRIGVLVAFGCAVALTIYDGYEARAQGLPWHEVGGVPFSPTVRSIEATRDDEPVWLTPGGTERRGALSLGARLPIFGSRLPSSECTSRWLLIGPEAWLCADNVRLSRASSTAAPSGSASRSLPFDYYTVTANGSFGYANFETAEEGAPMAQLEPGFVVAVRTVRKRNDQERYGLTVRGQWVPMRDLVPVHSSDFRGIMLPATRADTAPGNYPAWAVKDAAIVSPHGRATGDVIRRLSAFTLQSTELQRGQYLALDGERWVRARDVTWLRQAQVPAGVGPEERWLDVDTERQVLTAYEGSRAVFATLVSTGRGRASSPEATPAGLYRIWVKLETTEMSNLELETFDTAALSAPGDTRRYYAIEAVPWVLFFHQGYGLHATLWHDAFGTRRSHGCVNLSPGDAEFLFQWAGPNLPAGFRAVLPTTLDPGTWVRVR